MNAKRWLIIHHRTGEPCSAPRRTVNWIGDVQDHSFVDDKRLSFFGRVRTSRPDLAMAKSTLHAPKRPLLETRIVSARVR